MRRSHRRGNYTQPASGVLLIQIAGPNEYGRLAVTASAVLDGTLQVSQLDNYVPAVGASFQILMFADYTDGFTKEVGLGLPRHRSLKPIWQSDDLTLTASDGTGPAIRSWPSGRGPAYLSADRELCEKATLKATAGQEIVGVL